MVKHPQPDLYGKTSSEMSSITCEYIFRRIRFSLRHNLWMVFFSSNWRQRYGIPQIILHKYSLKPISNGFSLKCVFFHWFRVKIEYLRLGELHLQIALASIVNHISSKSRKILWLVSLWPASEEVLEMRSPFGVKGTKLFSFASVFHPKILTLTRNAWIFSSKKCWIPLGTSTNIYERIRHCVVSTFKVRIRKNDCLFEAGWVKMNSKDGFYLLVSYLK